MLSEEVTPRNVPDLRLEKRDFTRAMVRSLLLATAAAVFLVWCYLAYDMTDTSAFIFAVTGLVLTCVGLSVVDGHPDRANAVMITATFALPLALARASSSPSLLVMLILPVLTSAALFGTSITLALGLLASMATLVVAPAGTTWPIVVLPALGAVWSRLCIRELERVLHWSWNQSALASTLMEQLRDERGKLNQTIKDLDASYKLLQETNRQLLQARQEADTLRELRHRFAINLSHELRTPLNIIVGFANLVYRKPKLYGYPNWNGALLRDLAEVCRNAGHLSDLLDDVIDLARIDALAMPIRREATDLRALLADTAASVASLAEDRGLELETVFDDGLPEVFIDAVRIRQVILNLLANALRFTDEGKIVLRADKVDAGVVVSVADTGRGIAEQELQTIFDEFYQVSRPKNDPERGKGLGLAIAKRLVQLHGGSLWAESSLGEGSTFSFIIPLSEKRISRLRQPKATDPPSRRWRPKVAVLGDDLSSSYLSRRLDSFDFAHFTFDEAGSELAGSSPPEAVIVDSSAADGMRGEQILGLLPDAVPVIECPLPNMGWILKDQAFSGVLTKPVSVSGVVEAIERTTGREADRCRILIVDDERGFVQLLDRMLEAHFGHRCQIVSAYNGPDALARMQSTRPDVVLLDLVMDEMSGLDVLQAMRQDSGLSYIPAIAVTAATPGEDSLATGVAGFSLLVKGGFQPGSLTALLETVLKEFTGLGPARDIDVAPPETPLATPAL